MYFSPQLLPAVSKAEGILTDFKNDSTYWDNDEPLHGKRRHEIISHTTQKKTTKQTKNTATKQKM